MSSFGTSTIYGDLTVTGELKAKNLSSGTSSDCLPLTGGTLSGSLTTSDVTLDNRLTTGNKQISNASSDRIFIGNPSTQLQLESNNVPIIVQNNTAYNMYHTGNKPTAADIGAARALTNTNGYEGITLNNGLSDNWVRTTINGLIPHQSGGASSLGTSGWPFNNIYGNNIYENGKLLSNKYAPIDHSATGENTYIQFPKDGRQRKTASAITGYLKVTLPQSWTNTMIRFTVEIYNYQTHSSAEFKMGGYNYSGDSSWTRNPFAYIVAHRDSKYKNLAFRFGHDGTKCAIYIGESNTTWNYTQITVKDITVGYSNYELSKWNEGWDVGFTTTLGTITSTVTNTNVGMAILDSSNNLTVASKVYNAVWNDYAEFFEKEDVTEPFEPGDVVIWNKNGVIKSNKKNHGNVIGVYSDTYGHIVGGDANTEIEDNYDKYVPIGLSGRVDVKLTGKIKVGDLITTSDIPGVAMKAINPQLGTIIGKALQDKDTEEIIRTKMLIMNT